MRPWIVICRDLFAYLQQQGWGVRGHFILRGTTVSIVGLPHPWQARDADNDNGWVLA